MEAIRFVTHQTQVLQVHHNSAKFAYKYGPKIYMISNTVTLEHFSN